MKRILWSLICVLILFNFIFTSYCSAETAETDASSSSIPMVGRQNMTYSNNMINDLTYEGSTSDPRTGKTQNFDIFSAAGATINAVLGIVCMLFNIIPLTSEVLLTVVSASGTDILNTLTTSNNKFSFTIEITVFNEIGLFNIDYFDFNSTVKKYNFFGRVGDDGDNEVQIPTSMISIKENVAKWFYIARILSLAISLLVLIYVGIRMAMSTVASDRAKYKKMLISWVESIIILFMLQYIIQAIMVLGKLLVDITYKIKNSISATGTISFEQDFVNTLMVKLFTSSGSQLMVLTLMLWCVAFSHLRFFLLYMKRTIMLGFLIIIAPFITVTYPIDKMGDNKAQAFSAWFKELIIHIFIQPIHAILYLIFAFTAGEIAKYAPMFGLLFFMAIPSAEKMVRNIFGLNNSKSIDHLKAIGKPKGKH